MAQSNFKKVGNWSGARRLSTDLKKDIYFSVTKELMKIGLETERKVVKFIERQPAAWPPLNEKYKESKQKQGYSTLMLRRTGDYINRITSDISPDRLSVFVGVRRGVPMKGSDTEMWQIGEILEYGRKGENRTARPHFRPVQKLMNKKIAASGIFSKKTMEYLKRKYGL